MFAPKPPLNVLVTETRWDSFGEVTPRNIFLNQMLTEMGGVNHSVSPGLYHFNVRRLFFWNIVSLKPVK